jgi:AraC family transcriptional regulator, ethanolamine operon transcriptional activator
MPPIPVQRVPLCEAASARATVVRFGDIDEQAAALQGWNQRYLQLSRGRFDGTVERLQLDGVGLFIEDLHQSVHQTGWVRDDAIGVLLAVQGDARFCGRAASGDTLHVFSGRDGFEFLSPQRHAMIGIEMDRSLFEAHVEPAVGESAASDRARLLHADPAVIGDLRRFLVDLFQSAGAIVEDRGRHGHAPLRKQVRTQLLDRIALAMAPRDAVAADSQARATSGQSALVVRATEYVAHRLGDPPSVGEMCEALGVSRRTLQSAFQITWGMGPLAWLTTLRLNAVRRRLKSAGSVTEAATEFGFWHFGHFSGDYQALFGECPSHTLRRHRDVGEH